MPLILLVCLLSAFHLYPLGPVADWIQSSCSFALGNPNSALSKALLCGIRLPEGGPKDWIISWGLIHLFVVSGAHFLFIEDHLKSVTTKHSRLRYLLAPLLMLYAFATGAAPPVIRAGLVLVLKSISCRWKYHWSSAQILLLAGLLCFLVIPSEQHLSLQLSWIAALLLTIPCQPPFIALKKASLLWWGLLPLLSGLTWSHPVSILSNLVVLPLFQPVLFPLMWIDQMLLGLQLHEWSAEKVSWLQNYAPTPMIASAQDGQFKWIYLILLQALALAFQKYSEKAR